MFVPITTVNVHEWIDLIDHALEFHFKIDDALLSHLDFDFEINSKCDANWVMLCVLDN